MHFAGSEPVRKVPGVRINILDFGNSQNFWLKRVCPVIMLVMRLVNSQQPLIGGPQIESV